MTLGEFKRLRVGDEVMCTGHNLETVFSVRRINLDEGRVCIGSPYVEGWIDREYIKRHVLKDFSSEHILSILGSL